MPRTPLGPLRLPTASDLESAMDTPVSKTKKHRRRARQRKQNFSSSEDDNSDQESEENYLRQQRVHHKTPISKKTKKTTKRRKRTMRESFSPVKPPSPLSINVSQGVVARLAVINNDIKGLQEMLLDEPSLVDDVSEQGENGAVEAGWTMLHVACQLGHDECTELILLSSPNINAKTEAGSTPLHFACSQGHATCVKLLLDAGAKYHFKDIMDQTPKDNAQMAALGDCDVCVELIEEAEEEFNFAVLKVGAGVIGTIAIITGLIIWLRKKD